MNPLLLVEDLSFSYENGRRIFDRVDFTLKGGDILSIIGPNGAGKSTLMNCLAGLRRANRGRILVDGADIPSLPVDQAARLVGYMQQTTSIVYDYLVEDVVLMGRAPYISTMRLPGEEDRQIARDAMEQMCITHLARRPFTELSGGERQQVMIARLLTQQPRLILMDEPTSALDFGNQQRTIRMIRDLSRRGFAVIMTTHDPDHAVMLGDKVGTIDREGRFLFGPADEIITSETLSRLYNTDILVEYIPSFGRKVCGCT